jgi:hypothetical protein
LKSQLAAGEKPRFAPRPDSYFYDNKVDTRRIVSIIKNEILPLRPGSPGSVEAANQANIFAQEWLKKTNRFLNYRAAIIHHLGSPKMTLGELNTLCDKAFLAYKDFQRAHTAFSEVVQPYRFGMKELQYFYGSNEH